MTEISFFVSFHEAFFVLLTVSLAEQLQPFSVLPLQNIKHEFKSLDVIYKNQFKQSFVCTAVSLKLCSLWCKTDLWACRGAVEDNHLSHTSSLEKYPWSLCEL